MDLGKIIWCKKNLEKAHDLTERPHTEDVIIKDNILFNDLLLSKTTLEGLEACGFVEPSPIQRKAIPLGRCGFDLIVQAKSGTGKTCVFTVIALDMVEVELEKLQVLILTPTREISIQIRDVISGIGKTLKKLKVGAFIGGLPLENDKRELQKCHIAVGAPGRVKHLITAGLMKLDAVRLFVLDEADKLMEDNFRQDISAIYLKLPEVKQMIAASATFPPELEDFVTRYMTNPTRVSPGKDTLLIGIRQFISVIPSHLSVFGQMNNKLAELCRILSTVSFKQCMVFSNYQSRAESICNELRKQGWPAIYISGSQNQAARLKALATLKEFRCRVLLSTDLTSRGIDAENVNLIINFDLPFDGPTYMHRIGRAGRYGTYGLAITIVQSGEELYKFRRMFNEIGWDDFQVSLFPKENLKIDIWEAKNEDFKKMSSLEEESSYIKEISNGVDNDACKGRVEQREARVEIKKEALAELFSLQLTHSGDPEISEYDDLVEASLQLKGEDKEEEEETEKICQAKNSFHYKDYSDRLKSTVVYLEEEMWKEHRRKFQQSGQIMEVEGENKQERINENATEVKQPTEEKESDSDDSEKEAEELEDSYGDESDQDDDESDEDIALSIYHKKISNFKSEGCDENIIADGYARQWYSRWYSQLSIIRHYVYFFNYFRYCRMRNYR